MSTDTIECAGPTATYTTTVSEDVQDAISAALDAEPNVCTEVSVFASADAYDHEVARLTANWQELPALENGELAGWLPPYRALERFEDAIRDELPDGVEFERQNQHTITFFEVA